jgi:hypothetical protein
MMQEPNRAASNQGESGSSANDKFTVRAPTITLPKGGGAIGGIG